MNEPTCQKCRQVVNRGRDGSVTRVNHCAHGAAQSYRGEVRPAQCGNCALRQPLLGVGMICKEHPPSDPIWPEPRYLTDQTLVYPFREGVPAPPVPEGYRRVEEEGEYSWRFVSLWPECPYRRVANKRSPEGDLQINAYCGSQSNRVVGVAQCEKCSVEVTKLGGTLNEKTALKALALPESMKELDENDVPNFPYAAQLVATYWAAVKRWVAAGRPRRGKEEVKKIHTTLCVKCDWYDHGSQRCKGCGCRVAPKGIAILNKIEMATEHCPQKFW